MASQTARTLRPEAEVAHYRIVSPLGAGGMGEIYLAEDRSLQRRVAIKVLPPELVRDEDRVRRFELEARSASQLSHPNIVTIHEIGHAPVRMAGEPDSAPVHYIAMELVSGRTLASLIHEERADLRTLVGYLAQAADGLAKAHASGIVHRDLKPANVMVSTDGFTKVLDFGLAKLTESRERSPDLSDAPTMESPGSAAGSIVGTAGYMSPEQVAGRPVDHRSDVFSFGCVLYEAATRRRPFDAPTAVEAMHKILNEKPVPVEELNPQVPAELRRIIRRCLAKAPDQRVQSMKDLALQLREIVEEWDSLPASGSSAPSAAAVAAPARRTRPLVFVAAGAGVLAVVAALAFGLRNRGEQGEEAGGPQAFQTMRMSTQTSRGDVFDAALSRDGRYLAYLHGRAGLTGLRVRQVATGSDVEVVAPSEAGLSKLAFSPDGNYVYYLARRPEDRRYQALFVVPSLGGPPRERLFDVDSKVTFSPDGKRLACWRGVPQKQEHVLLSFDLESSRETVLATLGADEPMMTAPAWSPDGLTIALVVPAPPPSFGSRVVAFDAATGARRPALELPDTFLSSVAWLADGSGLVGTGISLKGIFQGQVFLVGYPSGRLQRVTNDFHDYGSVSASATDEAIASVRTSRLANLWIVDTSEAAARKLTSVTSPEGSAWNFGVAGAEQVVYELPQDGTLRIWSVDAAGGEPRSLTTDSAHTFNLKAAAGVVLFDRLDDTGVHIWRMAADGTGRRQVTTGSGEQVRHLSPDGRFAAFEKWDDAGSVHLFDLESGKVSKLVERVGDVFGFSPDSKRFLVTRLEPDEKGQPRPVWQALSVGGDEAPAKFTGPAGALGGVWTPDSRGVSFRRRSDPAWNVFRQGLAEGEPAQVTRFAEGRLMGHFWSPDGRKLAVTLRTREGVDLWVTEADGTRPVRVTRFPELEIFAVRWLPDSRRLVLSAGTQSRDAVLIRDFR
ncbi:MAG: protein kinase domain-containing protein [Thermoanaerobaculia bacterium]